MCPWISSGEKEYNTCPSFSSSTLSFLRAVSFITSCNDSGFQKQAACPPDRAQLLRVGPCLFGTSLIGSRTGFFLTEGGNWANLLGCQLRSLLSEYLRISFGSSSPARNPCHSVGSLRRFMIWVTLARVIPSFWATSLSDFTLPSSSIFCHSLALWMICFWDRFITAPVLTWEFWMKSGCNLLKLLRVGFVNHVRRGAKDL